MSPRFQHFWAMIFLPAWAIGMLLATAAAITGGNR